MSKAGRKGGRAGGRKGGGRKGSGGRKTGPKASRKPTKTKFQRKKVEAQRKPTMPAIGARRAITGQTRAKPRPRYQFSISHPGPGDFDGGLRDYSAYRDLGIADATGGQVRAHVIRMTRPFDAATVAIPHLHDVTFQMIYVLKGWFKTEFEGEGVHTFEAGSCWLQPPKIRHTVVGYSDDCELLEIIMPADFKTVTLAK